MNKIQILCKQLRIKQWIKNLFVFAPLIFSGKFYDINAFLAASYAFIVFCIAASLVYIINDIQDLEADKKHPKKSKSRPLAAGFISVTQAKFLMLILAVLLIVLCFGQWLLALVIGLYIMINIAYSRYLKYRPVIDIFAVASGYVLRVFAGAVMITVPVSAWMFVTVLSLAMYLAVIKRQKEKSMHGETKYYQFYTIELLRSYAIVCASSTLLFYSMFVITHNQAFIVTIPLVIFGLFRYWYLAECTEQGDDPTQIALTDWPLMLIIAAWGLTILYMMM